MESYKCKECERSFDKLDSLRKHRSSIHKIKSEQTYIEYVLNDVTPTCECGCGLKPKFLGFGTGHRQYKTGHNSSVKNNFNLPHVSKKAHETQKKKWENGEYTAWCQGLTKETDERIAKYSREISDNKERSEKISKALTGVPKTKEHIEKIKQHSTERWTNQEERDKQSERLIERLTKNNYRNPKTKLETKFEGILMSLGLNYEYQYRLELALFDFYLLDYNTLIEVDGNFHHCNPETHPEVKYPIQIKTVNNDIRKNKISEKHNFKLLRFWELDINNKPEEVILRLKQELSLSNI